MRDKRVPTTAQGFMGSMRGFLAVAAAHGSVAAVCDRRPQRPPRRSYRLAVPARLPNNQPLLETLPKLTPEGGHTPDAVNASAVFVAPNQFRVVYDASTDADLKEYQLRGNAGATFKSEDAVVIATNGPAAAREFLSGFGLTQPGAKVSVSVYVITNAGNEKGSTPMTITRPAA